LKVILSTINGFHHGSVKTTAYIMYEVS